VRLEQGSDWDALEAAPEADGAVMAAAEGGDRVLRLLAAGPRWVVAVDRNPAQLHLLELKLAAVRSLGYPEYLELTGLRPSRRRAVLYQRVRWLLPPESDEFWRGRVRVLLRGVAGQGEFERRLASFRTFMRLAQGREKVERFLTLRDEAERRAALEGEWQGLLWRKFAPFLWRRWFDGGLDRLERLLVEGRLQAPPPGLPEALFGGIKERAGRLWVVHEPPEAYLRALPEGSIDAFCLGRLDVAGLEGEIARVARPGAQVMIVSRRPSEGWKGNLVPRGVPCEAGFSPGWLFAGVIAK